MEEDNSSFKFNFNLNYSENVEHLLYNSKISVPLHTLQYKSESRPYCLPCNVVLSDIEIHFRNVHHHETDSILEIYHEAFVNGCEQFQAQQVFFIPRSSELIQCELCNVNVDPDDVNSHLRDFNHINNLKTTNNYWPVIIELNFDQNIVKPCDYSIYSTADSLSDKVLEVAGEVHQTYNNDDDKILEGVGCGHPLIFNRIGRANICLVCRTCEEHSISNHIAYTNHREKAVDFHTLSTLRKYHEFWWDQKEDKQVFAKFFLPFSFKYMKCLICMGRVLFSHTVSHMTDDTPCGFLTENDLIYEKSMNWEETFKKFSLHNLPDLMKYDVSVREIYYPENIMKGVMDREGWKVFTIQRQMENTRCLLCHDLLKDTVTLEDILKHIDGDFHKLCTKRKSNLLALGSYHKYWMAQPLQTQMKLYRFIPYNPTRFKCVICKNKIFKQNVPNHLKNGCETKNSDSDGKMEKDNSNGSIEINEEGAQSTSVQPEAIPKQTTILTSNYSKNVVTALYGKYNRPDQMHTFQKRSKVEYFCLICLKTIVITPHTHTDTKKHLKNYENPKLLQNLINYHNFWFNQANTYDQVNFNPLSATALRCATCTKPVEYADIPDHICRIKIKIEPVPEEFTASIKYHRDIVAKLYCNSLIEATNAVLKTKMPLACHWKGKITCYLCKIKIYRDMSIWKKHLEQYHSVHTDQRQDDLVACLAYHTFWAQHKKMKQSLQIYFLPHDAKSARCPKRHYVKYTDIFKHACHCDIREFAQFPLPSRYISEDEIEWLVADTKKMNISNGEPSNASKSESNSESSEEDIQNKSPNMSKAKVASKKSTQKLQKIKKVVGGNDNNTITHKVVASVEDPKATNLLKLIPNRLKYNLQHLSEQSELMHCSACDETMSLDFKTIITHLSQPSHISKTTHNPQKYVYFCDICFSRTSSEPMWHAHKESKHHISKCESLSITRKAHVKEYECVTCYFVIFGDQLSVNRHEKAFNFKREKRNRLVARVNLNPDAKKMLEFRSTVDAALVELLRDSDKAIHDDEALKQCLKALEDAIGKSYPDCKAHPFGSRVTGIGTLKSDLDVFVDIGGKYKGDPEFNLIEQQAVIRVVKKLFMEQKKVFNDILPIIGARTPIIKVVHISTDIDCDLSFRNGLSVENTKYIKFCIDLQPLFRPVMLLLKKWGDLVNARDELCSYALCMLMVFYMQQKKYLIPVYQLRQLTDPDALSIDGWSTITYNKSISELQEHIEIDNKIDPYTTLKHFFDYYSKFAFEEEVVCPLLGYSVSISKFKSDQGKDLPPEMRMYQDKVAKDPECQFRVMAQMFVQDPFDLGHNLTKAVPKLFRDRFKKLCALSAEEMRN